MEEWRRIHGYPLYEVSDEGRVKRVYGSVTTTNGITRHYRERILRTFPGGSKKRRYRRVSLWRNNEPTTAYVHRLVAGAFLGPCPDNAEVNHKDFNPANNNVDNLEYVTHSRNNEHYHFAHPGIVAGRKNPRAKLTESDVQAIRGLIQAGFQQRRIATMFNVAPSAINKIHLGQRWKHLEAPK